MDLTKRITFIPTYRYQPETLTFRANLLATAETSNERSLQHVDKFVRDCKEADIWNFLSEVIPLVGNGLTAATTKLKFLSTAYAVAVNFVSGDYSETTGLTGDAATKYLNLNVDSGTLGATGHMAFYSRADNGSSSNRSCLGIINSGSTEMYWLGSTNPLTGAMARWGKTTLATSGAQMLKGFYLSQRASTTDLRVFRNGQQVASASAATTPAVVNSLNVFAFAWNSNTTPLAHWNTPGSFISMGSALTDQQITDYSAIVQTLQTNLGRAV